MSSNQHILLASPEKALLDKIVTTSGVALRSRVNVKSYLLDDLRMDEETLQKMNLNAMQAWLPDTPKKESLQMVIDFIASI